jgi:cobyrinic acid a,c-diamide synthase
VVHGFCTFDPRLRVAGALLNRVGSENHRDLLEQAMAGLAERDGVDLLGCLERAPHLEAPSRHLGLVTAQDLGEGHALDAAMAARMADWLCAAMNPGQLVNRLPGRVLEAPPPGEEAAPPSRARAARIGVARDRAFCFYYHENFRILEAAGAELVFFSPLADSALPEDLDGLYLGGGYPELHAQALAANESMRRAVHAHARAGKPLLAECGGFMYCMDALEQGEVLHPMCGVFAMRCAMDDRFRALGYREAVTTAPGPLGPECTVVRGHEFHYSHITAPDPDAEPAYKLRDRRDWLDRKEGWTRGNALGSYVHLHFASNPGAARAWVEFCARRGAPQETP